MTDEEWLTAKAALIDECPLLFRHHGSAVFSFDIERGWHAIVRKLCLALEKIAEGLEAPPDDFEHEPRPGAIAITEKFGGLRFHHHPGSEMAAMLVAVAEADSWKVCEVCGEPGRLRRGGQRGGWQIKTVCDAHDKKVKR